MSSIADDETLLTLISVARQNREERKKVLSILNLEPTRRKIAVNILVTEMRRKNAPRQFVDAWDSLQDNETADAARKVIEDKDLDGKGAGVLTESALLLLLLGLMMVWVLVTFW